VLFWFGFTITDPTAKADGGLSKVGQGENVAEARELFHGSDNLEQGQLPFAASLLQ